MMGGTISDKASQVLLERPTLELNMKVKRLSSHATNRGREPSDLADGRSGILRGLSVPSRRTGRFRTKVEHVPQTRHSKTHLVHT